MSTTTTPRPWTPAELALLRDRYPGEGAKALARVLPGRTWQAVRCRAKHLGLRTLGAGVHAPGFRRWVRENGYPSLTARRLELWRYHSELEWPACGLLGPAERRLLAALERLGPATQQQLACALGLRLTSHHAPRRLHALLHRGLVKQQGRRVGDLHSHPVVWSLAGPATEAARRRREEVDLR